MATGAQLKDIAKARLKTGKSLLDLGDYDMAYYILGYALECALKAAICKTLKLEQYPDLLLSKSDGDRKRADVFRTHEFDVLLTLSGMQSDFSIANAPAELLRSWSDATIWKPENRYLEVGTKKETEAKRMYEALTNDPNGILTFVEKNGKW